MSGYVTGVPLPNQSLGQTQPTINTNFTVLNGNFAVDHVDFTNAPPGAGGNGGRHNTVTLVQQAADPIAVTTSPILYGKSTTGNTLNNDIYFRRASNDASTVVQLTTTKVNPLAAGNGSSFLPGGLMIQWGNQSFNGSQNPTVNFPTPFPNNCFNVQLTILNTNATVPATWRLTSIAPNQFVSNVQATGASTLYWVAIGN